jgi:hypothetical protein
MTGITYSFSKGIIAVPVITAPPHKPPSSRNKMYGDYCFRATCNVFEADMRTEAGHVVGYGKRVSISQDVEAACEFVVGKEGAKQKCGDVTMTMLPSSPRSCEGEIFFVSDGTSKKLV